MRLHKGLEDDNIKSIHLYEHNLSFIRLKMSEKMDVAHEIKRVEERMQQEMKELHEKIDKHRKEMDEFVKEKPEMAMGIVFLAGLTFGALMALMTRHKD